MNIELEQAARLLLEVAGPSDEHIEMSAVGPGKYYTVHRTITFEDCARHLQGIKTRGAQLRYPDGRTRALAFDTDMQRIYPGWWWMTASAQQLAEAGYHVLLEPSPAGRGGHLWVIFDGLVDARAARYHVCSIAPVLADVREYWPGPAHALNWNKVRLPGGRYVSPERSAWCKLFESDGHELARNGLEVASILLTHQTPARIVPPLPFDAQDQNTPAPDVTNPHNRRERRQPGEQDQAPPGVPARQYPLPSTSNAQLQEKYGEASRFLWFHYTPAQVAIWYNERHTVDDLLDFDRTGMANAEAIGRPERTPSVGSTRDREHWADFGAVAREDDGRPAGGDVLELLVRTSGRSKRQVLRELGREMVAEARAELESAAARQVDPPAWVQAILSESGWSHYRRLRNKHQRKSGPSGA